MNKFSFFVSIIFFLTINVCTSAQVTFSGPELLGKPTDNSITINIVPDADIFELYYEYGSSSSVYTMHTDSSSATANQPHEIIIGGLLPDTRYYYRMQYRGSTGGSWIARSEHTFTTQRSEGSTFKFDITADSHALLNSYLQNAMQNINNDNPDFLIDLGDTFVSNLASTQSRVDEKYMQYRDSLYFGAISHSVPIFLAAGNHENEEGWNFDDTPFSIALASVQSRKAYYPTPTEDGFYSGNTDPLAAIDEVKYGDELRENYYAWTWGDALFVVINEFHYTMDLPYEPAAGEKPDDEVTGDQWSWTLGEQQFNWFKQTIRDSDAKYKFVFSHHMLGGILDTILNIGPGYVRGGAGAAQFFEWGGNNADSSWGFDSHRPGWGGVPIHQLMVESGVSAYFHGHDHQFVYESLDGVVYQEAPTPTSTDSGFVGVYSESNFFTHKTLPNAGHLRVTVSPDSATVEYVRSYPTEESGNVSYTYAIVPHTISCKIKILLEGPYDSLNVTMDTNLKEYLKTSALSQPYNVSPWNYDGTEAVEASFFDENPTIVDWVLIEIRNSIENPTIIKQRAGFLKNDGIIVDIDGTSPIKFNAIAGNYFIVVKHRNHLEVMSANAVELPNGTSYNVTTISN